ncbi:MAG TPA: right-handed parallel beta-helix repeat-containing protein [Planctomycetota bacterium]
MTRFSSCAPRASLCSLLLAANAVAQSWLPTSPFPEWGATPPSSVASITYDPQIPAVANGAQLHAAILSLSAGEGLAVGPGTWVVPNRLDLNGTGTPQAPIWLYALDPQQKPVITRPNEQQNVINIGSNAAARYWVVRDLELTGGSDLIRLYDCSNVWIDQCYLHDGGGVGIAANSNDIDHVWITRCEIARPGPGTTGEGMYIGANYGTRVASWCVIAFNHVHDTRGAMPGQGDGIELKQGSHHNWIVGNHVHACQNPCIIAYGTGGNGQNVIENNLCYDSSDVTLQVQGEAIVRNNVAIGGVYTFSSHDHQGQSADLQVVHNTFVNWGLAARMSTWSDRPGMAFANNVVYSTMGNSILFASGSNGVQMAGNVVLGPVVGATSGFVTGTGLGDFADVVLGPIHYDVRPAIGGAIDNRGSPEFAVAKDMHGTARSLPVDPGAATNALTLVSPRTTLPLQDGGIVPFQFEAPSLAGRTYLLLGTISGVLPGIQIGAFTLPLTQDGWLQVTLRSPNRGGLIDSWGQLGPGGNASPALLVPPLPAGLTGLTADHVIVVLDHGTLVFVSNPVRVTMH